MTAERKPPGWVTSAGALVALGLAFAAWNKDSGKQEATTTVALAQAQRNDDQQQVKFQRMFDLMRAGDAESRQAVQTAKDDLRREIELSCRCCR